MSVLQTPGEPDTPTEQDHSRGLSLRTGSPSVLKLKSATQTPAVLLPGDLECEMKSDSSPERDHAHDDDLAREQEVTEGNKKRKRKPYRPGEETP